MGTSSNKPSSGYRQLQTPDKTNLIEYPSYRIILSQMQKTK